jgi:hypothetical protein
MQGRVGIIFSQAIMETLLAFFNHFPLFAIMLRIKDPGRLPGKRIFPPWKDIQSLYIIDTQFRGPHLRGVSARSFH